MPRSIGHLAPVVVLGVVSGCGLLMGIEPGTLDEGMPDSGVQTMPGDSGDAGGPDLVPAVIVPPGCEEEKPDEAYGLFVSPSGADVPNCGPKDLPCATLMFVIQRAKLVAGTKTVYVDSGRYAETLTTFPVGVTLQGGWDRLGQKWRRQCV